MRRMVARTGPVVKVAAPPGRCYTATVGADSGRRARETSMDFFGIGTNEMLWIAILAVILFGERLPEVARTVARLSKQLREASREFTDAFR